MPSPSAPTPRARSSRPASRSKSAPVVVGTDFSRGAAPAVERAAQVARATGAPLLVVHSVPEIGARAGTPLPGTWTGSGTSTFEAPASAMRAALVEAEREIGHVDLADDLAVERVVRQGAAHEALTSVAARRKARLVCIGVHAPATLAERYLLGSTAERVLRSGTTPVLLVRGRGAKPYGRILVAVDFSPLSLRCLGFVRKLLPEAQVVVAHVVEPMEGKATARIARRRAVEESLESLVEEAGYESGDVEYVVSEGDPRQAVVDIARRERAELIAMATHSRRGVERLLLGSVAERVVRTAHVDVLAVPPKAGR